MVKESKKEPNRIPYYVCFDKNYPGYFALIWYVKESIKKPCKTKYISVRSNGFKMDDQIFAKPSRLMDYFKKSQASNNEKRNRAPPPAPPPPSQPSMPKPQAMVATTDIRGPVRRGPDAVKPAWMTHGL